MRILLLELLEDPGKTLEMRVRPDLPSLRREGTDVPLLWEEDVRITARGAGGKKVSLSIEGAPVLQASCDRCLRPAPVRIPLDETEEVDLSRTEEERLADLDETPYLHGAELDVEEWITVLLHLNAPMKVLCREDCRGICPICGADLADGPCGCESAPRDPRMAAALDVFTAAQEKPQN